METAHIWSVSEGNALFIGLKMSAKFSYQADTDNRTSGHLLADTDMVADISCIPNLTYLKCFMALSLMQLNWIVFKGLQKPCI